MGLYAGIDLHSSNSLLGISDEDDKRHYKKRSPNLNADRNSCAPCGRVD